MQADLRRRLIDMTSTQIGKPATLIAVAITLVFIGTLILFAVSGNTESIYTHDSVTMYRNHSADSEVVINPGEEIIEPDMPIPLGPSPEQMEVQKSIIFSAICVLAVVIFVPAIISYIGSKKGDKE